MDAFDKKTKRLAKEYPLPFKPNDPFLVRLLKRASDELPAGSFALNATQLQQLATYVAEPLLPDLYVYEIGYFRDDRACGLSR